MKMRQMAKLVLFAISVQMMVKFGNTLLATTHAPIIAKNGESVTLPCSHGWNLSRAEDRKDLDHATWFLTNPDRTDTVASHECPDDDPKLCKTRTSNSQVSLDLDFENQTANLIITNVQSTNSGVYFCLVVTVNGIIQTSVKLTVSGSDASVRITSSGGHPSDDPGKLIVTANTSETLKCSAYVKKGSIGTLTWKAQDLNLQEEIQKKFSISDDEDYVTSSVTFHPTHADNGKWIECGIRESEKSPRRVRLVVKDKTDTSSTGNPLIPINNETSSQVCFHRQSRKANNSSRNNTCCHARDIVILPSISSNGDIAILCCTGREVGSCHSLQFNIAGDSKSDAEQTGSQSSHTIATIMSISLYVIIGAGILIILSVFIWRRRKVFLGFLRCRKEHVYCDPPDLPARVTSLPPPPLSWIEYEDEDGSFMTSYEECNSIRDDELQELSTTFPATPREHTALSAERYRHSVGGGFETLKWSTPIFHSQMFFRG
ncbi:uncharacterized protein LOC121419518 [Lytechinus variegatus]|uniref:uncharacterized protein LOC121419518 n=1 Tax=Lytechinus variegatus TaxID=7654 RepID=UPI001BB14D61|nr:uncharacterized protein LOC121419518 [Lytechinus variegatus]